MPARIAFVAVVAVAACSTDGAAWRSSPAREGRAGLGTSWGETRWAPIREVPFERASEIPFARASIFYDDREGVAAMAGRGDENGDGSYAGLETLVVDDRGEPLETVRAAGRTCVVGERGQRYRLLVRNRTARRLEVVASVDGLDVVDGRRASPQKRGYILNPYETLSIDGFRRNLSQVAAFRFGAVADSYAARTGGDQNVGVIGFAFFDEQGDEAARRLEAQPFSDARFAQPPSL